MTQIVEDYVSFETAKLLKEKGFDEPCIWLYDKKGEKHYASDYHSPWPNSELAADEWSCCTQAMAMKWLREENGLHCHIDCPLLCYEWRYAIRDLNKDEWIVNRYNEDKDTYEEAVEAAIKYCLENLI